jgi:hypothetical protein
MDTTTNKLQITALISTILAPSLSLEAKSLVSLGSEMGWDIKVIGRAPLPTEPVRIGEWLLVPADQDTSPLPPRSFERVQQIYKCGLRPAGFVIAHEAPALLAPEIKPAEEPIEWAVLSPEHKRLMKRALGVLVIGTLGIAILPIVLAAVAAVAGALFLPAAMVAGVAIDPILIAVTEDGYWIEIDRWWNE